MVSMVKIYNELVKEQIPADYNPATPAQVISDFIHLQHRILTPYRTSALFIDKLRTNHCNSNFFKPQQSLLSPRKQYEVTQFTEYIHRSIQDHGYSQDLEFIIEYGSGKSYLSRSLISLGFKLICIEINPQRVSTAKKLDLLRHGTGAQNGTNNVIYLTELQSQQSQAAIRHFVNANKKSNQTQFPKALIIGLDSCGEIVPNLIMDMFMDEDMKNLTQLDIVGCCFVPCCFHKVSQLRWFKGEELNSFQFANFAGTQDLRHLMIEGQDDVVKCYLNECGLDELKDLQEFSKWCFDRGKGVFSEFMILRDRLELLKHHGASHESKLDVVFDFRISSRNIAITAFKPIK